MPRGIPKAEAGDTPPVFLRIALLPEHQAALAKIASEQYRTPELQAAYLLARVLSEAGQNTAERIKAYAKSKADNGEAH